MHPTTLRRLLEPALADATLVHAHAAALAGAQLEADVLLALEEEQLMKSVDRDLAVGLDVPVAASWLSEARRQL